MKTKIGTNLVELTANKSSKNVNIAFSFNNKLLKNSKSVLNKHTFFKTETVKNTPQILTYLNSSNPYIIANLGEMANFSLAKLQQTIALLASYLKNHDNTTSINFIVEDEIAKKLNFSITYLAEQTAFHFLDQLYIFDNLVTTKKVLGLQKINFSHQLDLKKELENAVHLFEGIALVKDLANNPANVATPSFLANIATNISKISKKITIDIIDAKEAKKLKMFTFLSVAQGSVNEPKFIVMQYAGGKASQQPVVLVGKGVTFDTGGISLKPSSGMELMKYDMCGAATVLGVFLTTVKLNLPINLIIAAPCTENSPSGSATRPGDVVTSMSGSTVEIMNTDAEGRLILSDALTYVKRFNPKLVIDLATLTGACVVALGHVAAALYANDDNLANSLTQSSIATNDKVWRMPLFDEFAEGIKHGVADIANLASWDRAGGSITAAKFLQHFTDYPWAHLDIAGVAYNKGYNSHKFTDGATGRPFFLLLDFLRNYGKK